MQLSFIWKFQGLLLFTLFAALVTVLIGSIFVTGQHLYRSNANDPQVEISEQISEFIKQGAPADAIIDQEQAMDITNSLSAFAIVYDKDGKLVVSSGKIGEEIPTPPSSVFDSAKATGQNRFTWEPKKGTRIAAVLRKVDDEKGFILVGRNLREIENREQALTFVIAIIWIVLLGISALLSWMLSKISGSKTLVEEHISIEEKPVTIVM
jgi:sensor histidine kinase regulating citrate/malate metabolism